MSTPQIAFLALLVLAALGLVHATAEPSQVPPARPLYVRLCWIMAATLAALMLGGCKTAPVEGPPMKDPADSAACAPLPTCQIPEKASSTQLEEALWECVLEYRALYSVCYYMQHRTPEK